ncbi:hypothetical protein CDD83_176 [Cordyceps sp. RAO-2017]|nr:hypothetical protein CDD83_176 [Cordyceps sp. RAO-2017]
MQPLIVAVLLSTLAASVFAEVDLAATEQVNHDGHEFRAARPDDSRGPCPAMNALANHGYINRDGRKIGLVAAVKACSKGLGASPEVCGISAFRTLLALQFHRPLAFTFNLDELRRHKSPIEHDVSFSREDQALGDNNVFNPAIWRSTLDVISRVPIVTPEVMGKAKAKRVREQTRKNPQVDYDSNAAIFGGTEVGMLLTTFGYTAPNLRWIRCLFEEERIPTHLGWRPQQRSTNLSSTLSVGKISLQAQGNIPESLRRKMNSPLTKLFSQFLHVRRKKSFMQNMRMAYQETGLNSTRGDELAHMMGFRMPDH